MNLATVRDSITLLERLFDPRHATEAFIGPTEGKPKWEHIKEKGMPFVDIKALSDAGISPKALHAYLTALHDTPTLDTHGIVIAKNAKVLARIHFGAHDMTVPRYVYSASKTVTAMAVGLLFDRGLLSPADKLVDLFPSYFNPVTRRRLANLTVEDLLTMRSAVSFGEGEAMTDDDWVKCFLLAPASGEAGVTFAYNSLNTYMLSVIVTLKTGMTLYDFVKAEFFTPLGIENTFWEACPRDNTIGGWGLYIAPSDLCKMAALLFDGTFEGKRYLSTEFVEHMRTPLVGVSRENGAYDYGYQMWVNPQSGVALMNGMFGQNVFFDARSGITLAVCSGNGEVFQKSETYPVTEAFLASVGASETWDAADEIALSDLVFSLCEQPVPQKEVPKKRGFFAALLLRLLAPKEETPKETAPTSPFEGHTFTPTSDTANSLGLLPLVLQAVRNHYTKGFHSLSVGEVQNDEVLITWTEADTAHTFSVSLDGVSRRTWLTFGKSPYLIDAKGAFAENEDGEPVLSITLVFAETPHTRRIKLFAHKDGTYTLIAEESPGEALIAREATAAKHKVEDTPIIGSFLSKIDDDYLSYRVQRTFSPRIGMERK